MKTDELTVVEWPQKKEDLGADPEVLRRGPQAQHDGATRCGQEQHGNLQVIYRSQRGRSKTLGLEKK